MCLLTITRVRKCKQSFRRMEGRKDPVLPRTEQLEVSEDFTKDGL